jgi:hypothetical protein
VIEFAIKQVIELGRSWLDARSKNLAEQKAELDNAHTGYFAAATEMHKLAASCISALEQRRINPETVRKLKEIRVKGLPSRHSIITQGVTQSGMQESDQRANYIKAVLETFTDDLTGQSTYAEKLIEAIEGVRESDRWGTSIKTAQGIEKRIVENMRLAAREYESLKASESPN